VSEIQPGEIVLVPSRTRRRLLEWAAVAVGVLALALAAAGTGPALCSAVFCGVCAAAAIWQARHDRSAGAVRLDPAERFLALSASRTRIVFFAAQRRVVVWHDATDRATYRRLAIRARWQPRSQSR